MNSISERVSNNKNMQNTMKNSKRPKDSSSTYREEDFS
jgi:hypothetical protein